MTVSSSVSGGLLGLLRTAVIRVVTYYSAIERFYQYNAVAIDLFRAHGVLTFKMKCPSCNSDLKIRNYQYRSSSRKALASQMCRPIRYVSTVILNYVRLCLTGRGGVGGASPPREAGGSKGERRSPLTSVYMFQLYPTPRLG